jgi:hypothetical protein
MEAVDKAVDPVQGTVQVLNLSLQAVLQTRSRKEPHHFSGAGAVTRCASAPTNLMFDMDI